MKTLLTLSAISLCSLLQAQIPGTLDSTFADNGYALYLSNEQSSSGNQIIQQPDGKLIVAGGIFNSSAPSPAFLMRINPDSTVDNSFANNGIAEIEVGYLTNIVNATREIDEKITVALIVYDTSFNSNLAFARYGADGQPDSTFGEDGIVLLDNSFPDSFNKIFPDNTAYLSANADPLNQNTYLHRWNHDGSPDLSFGTAGAVTVGNFLLYDAAQQSDGKLILFGSNIDLQLRQYAPTGIIDSAFGTNGIVVINTSGITQPGEIYIDSLNRTYVQYGVDAGGFNFYPRINRFSTDGSQDMTWGETGNVDLDTEHSVSDMGFNGAAKITIAGFVEQSSLNGFLMRLHDDGSMDPEFGTGGETIISVPFTNEYFDDVLVGQGKIYTVGTSGISAESSVLIARFNDAPGTSLEEFSFSEPDISVMPNPAITSCFIKSSENIEEIRVISTDGSTCIVLNGIKEGEAGLNLAGLEPGTYYVQILQKKSMTTRKVFVIR